jgi:CopG family nickel-responsive transcriptional regulator
MSTVYRFGISLDKQLIEDFDRHIQRENYKNRSEAIRDLIREELVREQWRCEGVVAGAITLTYDHHKRDLVNKVIAIQHDFHHIIISSQHAHLDHHNCLEIIAVKGTSRDVSELAARLKSTRDVLHVALTMSTTGTAFR